MKRRRRRTEITHETEEILVFSKHRHARAAWCSNCSALVEMLTPEEAAAEVGVSARTVFRWTEAGQVHFAETPAGLLLVCYTSLPKPPLDGASR